MAQVRDHLLRDAARVVVRRLARHRAEVGHHHDHPDADLLDQRLELLGHLRGRALDHDALFDELGPRALGDAGVGELRGEAAGDGALRAVAGRVDEAAVDVLGFVVEPLEVLAVELGGHLLVIGDADELDHARAVGVARQVVGVDDRPELLEGAARALEAGEGERGVHMAFLADPVPGLDGAPAGNPDRRARLLERPRPDVDVAELRVAPVEGEGFLLRPGADDQPLGLAVLLAERDRVLPVAVVRIHARTDGEAGDDAATAHAVEHRDLFRHADRRVVERDAVAEEDDRDVLRLAGERGGDDVRRRHQAVAVLVVLVDADPVVAQRRGVDQLIDVLVVELAHLLRVLEPGRDVDPDAVVGVAEVVRQVAVRHEVERVELHAGPSSRRGRRPSHDSAASPRQPPPSRRGVEPGLAIPSAPGPALAVALGDL